MLYASIQITLVMTLIFSQALSPMQECFWKTSLLGKITNALRIPAGATAQATASNRSRIAADTLERSSTNLKFKE